MYLNTFEETSVPNTMMRLLFLLTFLLISTFSGLQAQRLSRVTYGLDVGTGFTSDAFTPTINYYQNLTFGNLRFLGIGWTGRFGGNVINGNPVLKTLGNPGEQDQISLKRIITYDAAFGVTVNFDFEHIEFGANVDLVNLSFGKNSKVLYKIADLQQATDSVKKLHNTLVSATPQSASLLPIATKKSNGHSEAYVRLWINQEFGVKLGYQLMNVVYNTKEPLSNNQKRFVDQYGMPFLALSFHIQN